MNSKSVSQSWRSTRLTYAPTSQNTLEIQRKLAAGPVRCNSEHNEKNGLCGTQEAGKSRTTPEQCSPGVPASQLYFCTITYRGNVLMGGHWLAPDNTTAKRLARRAYLQDYKRFNYPVIELCVERARKSTADRGNALNAPAVKP